MQVAGLVKVAASIQDALNSESVLNLTRSSISHYEGIYQVPSLNERKLLTVTMLHSILIPGPNSGKIRATLQRHAPELWTEVEELMESLSAAAAEKSELKENGANTSTEVSQGEKTTKVTI
eukprot:10743-Amphidinium_carterae.1